MRGCVKRVTVSIPPELAARAEKWSDNLSPSRIYQEALEVWVTKKEALAERVKGAGADMAAIVERLKAQKMQTVHDFYDEGQEEGAAWARTADYREFQYAAQDFYPFSRSKRKPGVDKTVLEEDRLLRETFQALFDKRPDLWRVDHKGLLIYEAETFLKGWHEAVKAFWEAVAPQIDA
ncbi:MAG: hypothetical protein FWG97_00570 [Deltaproteobacteria bacterium]|nr:hypothetical protein [Deltaproteobacteria bacterium]